MHSIIIQKYLCNQEAMDFTSKQQLVAYLKQFITKERREHIEQLAPLRTRYVTPVLEDPYHSHNISAVLRTTECLGMQDVHVVEERNPYAITNGVAKGAGKWLNLHRYGEAERNNTQYCLRSLREQGYRIVATAPTEQAYTPETVPIDQKTALIFGTEVVGLTEHGFQEADMTLAIPMYGFTESFNISVSSAVCMYTIMQRVRASDHAWQLSQEEQLDVELAWLRATINRVASYEHAFFTRSQ